MAFSAETRAGSPSTPSTPVPLDQLFDISVFPPSCRANGYSIYRNLETGAINVRDEVPRLMHDYSAEITTEDGETIPVCSMCGATVPPEEESWR